MKILRSTKTGTRTSINRVITAEDSSGYLLDDGHSVTKTEVEQCQHYNHRIIDVDSIAISNAQSGFDYIGSDEYKDPVTSYRQNAIDTLTENGIDSTEAHQRAILTYNNHLAQLQEDQRKKSRSGVKRADVVDAKRTKAPQPRLTADGYTKLDGSPSDIMVKLKGYGNRWRRVYILQFSNAASQFCKVNGEDIFINLDSYDLGKFQTARAAKEAPNTICRFAFDSECESYITMKSRVSRKREGVTVYYVIYGLQCRSYDDQAEASKEFRNCIAHAMQSEGLDD